MHLASCIRTDAPCNMSRLSPWSLPLWSLRSLFFPDPCSGCGRALDRGMPCLCPACMASLPHTGLATKRANSVERIFWGRVDILAAFAELHFTPASIVRNILHNIKYHDDRRAAIHMGRMMGRSMRHVPPFRDLQAIVPLPLHPARLKKRGYNQAELLAIGISEVTGIPLRTDLLHRVKETGTQTRRSRLDRWENMRSAFHSDSGLLSDARLLLVDDVLTTGATLEAAAATLLENSSRTVCIATLAWADK